MLWLGSVLAPVHYEQGDLRKEAFKWGFDYSFRGLIHEHHGGIGGRHSGMVLEQ